MLLSALLLIPLCLPLTSCGECEVHTFGAWTTSIQATCTSTGQEVRTCTVCDAQETQETSMLPHTFGAWMTSVQATCTSTGQEVRTCTVCDAQETQGTSMLPHTFGAWTTSVQATCQSTGTDTRTCTACGKVETTTTPIGSHSEVKGKCQYCDGVMNAYNVLLYATKDKGSYNNGTYTLVLGSTTYDGSSYKRFAQYNATDDELQILILWKASTLLTITLSEYSTIYEYTLFADTHDRIMVGSFYLHLFQLYNLFVLHRHKYSILTYS